MLVDFSKMNAKILLESYDIQIQGFWRILESGHPNSESIIKIYEACFKDLIIESFKRFYGVELQFLEFSKEFIVRTKK